jgi:hypothetical protein
MKMPWHNQTGLAKAAALLATIFGVAVGLCGANFVAVITLVPVGGSSGPTGFRGWISNILGVTAYIELAAMILSAAGLVVLGVVATVRAIARSFTND